MNVQKERAPKTSSILSRAVSRESLRHPFVVVLFTAFVGGGVLTGVATALNPFYTKSQGEKVEVRVSNIETSISAISTTQQALLEHECASDRKQAEKDIDDAIFILEQEISFLTRSDARGNADDRDLVRLGNINSKRSELIRELDKLDKCGTPAGGVTVRLRGIGS